MKTSIATAFFVIAFILGASLTAFAQPKPDLIIRSVKVIPDNSGKFVESVKVSVMNYCNGSNAPQSYVLVAFMTVPDGKHLATVGAEIKPLTGGATDTHTLDFSGQKIGLGMHTIITIDPSNKISEASEDNNTQMRNPYKSAALIAQYQCSPKI
jgi:hypothetical protein